MPALVSEHAVAGNKPAARTGSPHVCRSVFAHVSGCKQSANDALLAQALLAAGRLAVPGPLWSLALEQILLRCVDTETQVASLATP